MDTSSPEDPGSPQERCYNGGDVGTHDGPQSWTGRVLPNSIFDDFVVLVSGSREQAEQEKAELAKYLHETMRLELSIEKTNVVDLAEGFQFLGHRVRYKWHPRFGYMPRLEIPTSKRADFRYTVKQMTGRTSGWSLARLLQKLNPILRGWGNYYRFCTGGKPSVRDPRLQCRRSHLALADEEAWSPSS